MRDKQLVNIKPDQSAEETWTQQVLDDAEQTLFPTADSWFMGVNQNVADKKRTFMLYVSGSETYRKKCDEVAANDYEGFALR